MVLFLPLPGPAQASAHTTPTAHTTPIEKPAPLRIAVAANFKITLKQLIQLYQQQRHQQQRPPITSKISSASTGTLYTQIIRGAPFDLFFAADVDRPQRLVQEGKTLSKAPYIYARGQLVFWMPTPSIDLATMPAGLTKIQGRIAIANPKTAPYGLAAKTLLEKASLWTPLHGHLIQGNNISQAFQYVQSGAAEAGFVAAAQLQGWLAQQSGFHGLAARQDVWIPLPADYRAIEQAMVVLKSASLNPEVQGFVEFIQSDRVRAFIKEAGYLDGYLNTKGQGPE